MTGVTTQLTLPAEDIKPRDLLVFMDQAKVASVSHQPEFHVSIRTKGCIFPTRLAKVQYVTVIREVQR